MRPMPSANEISSIQSEPAQSAPLMPSTHTGPPDMSPLQAVTPGNVMGRALTAAFQPVLNPKMLMLPTQSNVALPVAVPVATPIATPTATPLDFAFAPAPPERQTSEQALDDWQLDDFLQELQLHSSAEQATLHAVAASLTGEATGMQGSTAPTSGMLSQASLHQLLQTLSGPESTSLEATGCGLPLGASVHSLMAF